MPTPIGNIEDLSFRSLKKISSAEVILCEDTRVTKSLLSIIRSHFSTDFTNNPKLISFHSHNEDEMIASFTPEFFNQNVIFMSDAGMPAISDPGAKLVDWCHKNGVEFEVLVGANAALTAYVASGELSGKFIFYGFLPHKLEAKKQILLDLMSYPFSVVLYESPKRILDLIDLIAQIEPERKLFLAKELTKKFEKRFLGLAKDLKSDLINHNLNGEWCAIIYPSQHKLDPNAWLIDELRALETPLKPLSKILAKLTNSKSSIWYQHLLKAKQ